MIKMKRRVGFWRKIASVLVDTTEQFPISWQVSDDEISEGFDRLSAGQSILLLVMTQLIANIEDDSMVLFDEPEIHLHPEAVSTVASVMQEILEEFHSYAVIATHSPVIIQEVPSYFVRVLRRQGNVPWVDRLDLESFGESLSNISNSIFQTSEERQNYRNHLRNMARTMELEEILEVFDQRLSFNALAFLHAAFLNQSDN